MKRIICILIALLMTVLCACNADMSGTSSVTEMTPEPPGNGEVLIAYFSATGNTRTVAEYIKELTGGDMLEITPKQPYTSDDLKYYTDCRADREQNDPSFRPELDGNLPDLSSYGTVYLGYPIWHGKAPRIVLTFLETARLEGKRVIPFCTSASSPVGDSVDEMMRSADKAIWSEGVRFGSGVSKDNISEWLGMSGKSEDIMKITVGDKVLEAEFADNASAKAFAELLKKGDVTVDMSDYGNFEKVGPLPEELPRCDERITTQPGDIILYLGKSLTLYYDTNTWDFTLLGKIKSITGDELKSILGDGDVTVIFSLK